MFPYLILLFILMFYIFIQNISINRKSIFIPILMLVIFASVRSYYVGTDTRTYLSNFTTNLDANYFSFNSDIEYGYQFLEFIILNFTHNYFWLFFVTSMLVVPLYLITIKKLSENYILSIFIYITFGYYTFFFNGLRQGIAMALFFFSLPYLVNRKIVIYSLIIFTASLFHISALMMIPLYFLIHLKLKIEWKVLYCFLISILSSQILIKYLAQSNVRYESYTQEAEKAGGYITLLFYFLLGLLIYLVGNNVRNHEKMFSNFEQIYLCGLALIFPLALLGTDPSGPQRLLYYFSSLVILLLPYILNYYRSIYVRIFFIFFSVIYFILTTMRFSNLYPYSINPIFEVF